MSTIIVFDFETGGLDPEYHEAIQIAGKAYDDRSLEPYPPETGGEFCSLMKPLYFDRLDDKALQINGKTREMLEAAPEQKQVWNEFVGWVGRFNPKKSAWGAPIAAGKNIEGFDLKFVNVLNRLHCPKGEKTVLFARMPILDIQDDLYRWFRNDPELKNYKMDTVRVYMGMDSEGAHDALVDVRQTGELLMRFLGLYDRLKLAKNKDGGPLIKFKGSCKQQAA